jgi:hypothetical protein
MTAQISTFLLLGLMALNVLIEVRGEIPAETAEQIVPVNAP